MALSRLSTIQTWAVFSVITLCLTAAHAQTNSSVTDEAYKAYFGGCTSIKAEMANAYSDIGEYCGAGALDTAKLQQCVEEKIKPCDESAISAKENILAPDEDTLDRDPGLCGEIRKFNEQCPGAITVSPEDAARNRKEIRSLRDDLRKERQEARKNDAEKLKQNQDETNKIMDEMSKNDQDWQKQRKELNDKLREILKNIDADSMKALMDMQKRLDEIDMEYISYRNALRRKISTANDIELTWNTQCRAVANEVANQAEAELNKRLEAEALIARNYRASNLAGKMRRDLRIKRRRIVNKFNETLAKCLRGDAEPGAGMKLKLSQAKNDVRDSTAEANDKAARLEKLRQQIANNVNTMAKTLSDERQQAVQSNQQDLALLDQANQANQQRLQQRQQQIFQNQWRDSLEQMQAQKELDQRLNDMMGDEALASAEYMCHRKMSRERASELNATRGKAVKGFFKLSMYCRMPKKKDASGAECDLGNSDLCDVLKAPKSSKTDRSRGSSTQPGQDEGSNPSDSPVPTTAPPPKPKGSNGSTGRAGASQ